MRGFISRNEVVHEAYDAGVHRKQDDQAPIAEEAIDHTSSQSSPVRCTWPWPPFFFLGVRSPDDARTVDANCLVGRHEALTAMVSPVKQTTKRI